MTAFGVSDPYQNCAIFAQLLKLLDEDVRRVLALVMADTLEASGCHGEAVGVHLKVELSTSWKPDDAVFDRPRASGDQRPAGRCRRQERCRRQSEREHQAAAVDHPRLPCRRERPHQGRELAAALVAFPPQSYTDRDGFRPAQEWSRVAELFA